MADPAIQAFQANSEILAGAPIPFRFEVTWGSLTQPLVESSPPYVEPPAGQAEPREWEMVLPRMRRPATIAPTAPRELEPAVAAPQFTAAAEPAHPRWLIPAAGIGLLFMLGGASYLWLRPASPAMQESVAASGLEMGGAGWLTEWASDSTGSARGRQISLYHPSVGMSDYNLEFLGRIEHRSLGWVFRAADSNNYYVAKLEADSPGSSALTVTRFAVIRGFEGLHIQRSLTMSPGGGDTLKVKLEARGPRFTIYVQNQVVEDWEDDRLKSGALGFLTEREERGQIGSIQVSFPKGGKR